MLILCGKTCAGKDRVLSELEKFGFEKLVTYTTRPKRPGEIEGKSYHFISEGEFRRLKDDGFFAETTSYDTVHGKWYYGSAKENYQKDKVMIANPDGVKILRNRKDINPVFFYIYAPNDVLAERLIKRGDDPAEAKRRLESDKNDFYGIENYVDLVFINRDTTDIEELAKQIYDNYTKRQKECIE